MRNELTIIKEELIYAKWIGNETYADWLTEELQQQIKGRFMSIIDQSFSVMNSVNKNIKLKFPKFDKENRNI